jgi:hypothetical protein
MAFMQRQWHGIVKIVGYLALILTGTGVFPLTGVTAENRLDIPVHVSYHQPLPQDDFQLTLVLLDDTHDLLAQITALQEKSKPELEPLIKQYMYAAEMLGRLAVSESEKRTQFQQQFADVEQQINNILAGYRQQIDGVLEAAMLASVTCSSLKTDCLLSEIKQGKYRVHAELSFSTTTLRWFEPVDLIKGGDNVTVMLTRDNLNTPYWTDLNWWSFMNLDFSKHH